jgi:sec-independent protein translocase protein TatB
MNSFLLILESLGTSELILIGIIALIFLGPRKLPEIARKLGKIMADFRNTTSEFKETWEREVNFEEEAKALRSAIDDEPVPRVEQQTPAPEGISAPEVRQVDASAFESNGLAAEQPAGDTAETEGRTAEEEQATTLSEKKDWL